MILSSAKKRAFPLFSGSHECSLPLFSRISGRKTASHFFWKCSWHAASVLWTGAAILLLAAFGASADEEKPKAPPVAGTPDEIQQFCSNIAVPARDRRYVLQKQELEKLQADIDDRLKQLDARKAEYQDWLKRRNDFLDRADADLVNIYKTMKPDAAASRLAAVEINVAAAILMKLSPKQSGLILAEMDPDKAARLTAILSMAADPTTSKGRT